MDAFREFTTDAVIEEWTAKGKRCCSTEINTVDSPSYILHEILQVRIIHHHAMTVHSSKKFCETRDRHPAQPRQRRPGHEGLSQDDFQLSIFPSLFETQ